MRTEFGYPEHICKRSELNSSDTPPPPNDGLYINIKYDFKNIKTAWNKNKKKKKLKFNLPFVNQKWFS